jgi:hypothetical protein
MARVIVGLEWNGLVMIDDLGADLTQVPALPRAVPSRQSISSIHAVSAVLMSKSSCPRLAGTLLRWSLPGPGRTSNVHAAS